MDSEEIKTTETSSTEPEVPGKKTANVSLILGIASIVLDLVCVTSFLGLVAGIIGMVFNAKGKNEGYTGTETKAGFICSLIGIILSVVMGIVFFACVAVCAYELN